MATTWQTNVSHGRRTPENGVEISRISGNKYWKQPRLGGHGRQRPALCRHPTDGVVGEDPDLPQVSYQAPLTNKFLVPFGLVPSGCPRKRFSLAQLTDRLDFFFFLFLCLACIFIHASSKRFDRKLPCPYVSAVPIFRCLRPFLEELREGRRGFCLSPERFAVLHRYCFQGCHCPEPWQARLLTHASSQAQVSVSLECLYWGVSPARLPCSRCALFRSLRHLGIPPPPKRADSRRRKVSTGVLVLVSCVGSLAGFRIR